MYCMTFKCETHWFALIGESTPVAEAETLAQYRLPLSSPVTLREVVLAMVDWNKVTW